MADRGHRRPDTSPCSRSRSPCRDAMCARLVLVVRIRTETDCARIIGCGEVVRVRTNLAARTSLHCRSRKTTNEARGDRYSPLGTVVSSIEWPRCVRSSGVRISNNNKSANGISKIIEEISRSLHPWLTHGSRLSLQLPPTDDRGSLTTKRRPLAVIISPHRSDDDWSSISTSRRGHRPRRRVVGLEQAT